MGIVAEWFAVKTALVSGGARCIAAVFEAVVSLSQFAANDGRDGIKQREIEESERSEMSRLAES